MRVHVHRANKTIVLMKETTTRHQQIRHISCTDNVIFIRGIRNSWRIQNVAFSSERDYRIFSILVFELEDVRINPGNLRDNWSPDSMVQHKQCGVFDNLTRFGEVVSKIHTIHTTTFDHVMGASLFLLKKNWYFSNYSCALHNFRTCEPQIEH